MEVITDCEIKLMDEFLKSVIKIVKNVREFNDGFMKFLESQKKSSKELHMLVTRYNVLKSGPPCVYPIIEKEEILSELLVKIQEQTSKIGDSISSLKSQFDQLPKLHQVLRQNSSKLVWNPTTNLYIRGTVKHRPPSEYLEEIADILFQYEVSITCMQQYFDVLVLSDTESYLNLANSFSISDEVVEAVNEFLIKNSYVLK